MSRSKIIGILLAIAFLLLAVAFFRSCQVEDPEVYEPTSVKLRA